MKSTLLSRTAKRNKSNFFKKIILKLNPIYARYQERPQNFTYKFYSYFLHCKNTKNIFSVDTHLQNLEGLVAWCHSVCLLDIFKHIHSVHHIHTVHSSFAIRRGSSPSPHRWSAQWEKPPRSAEPRIELGPALQQADVLPSKLRRALAVCSR